MGDLMSAVQWWEDSQLRVLILASLVIQFFLFSFSVLRRQAIPGWFRFVMWLAYHGGDAVAIYALAALFNRHKQDEGDGGACRGGGGGSNTLLEVVWAPVFLIHLGGRDGVTAYNIEDNELWSRHLLTAVSQVTVAIYVFCKSWPRDGDKKLLAAATLLFVVGLVKCLAKAWAFKRASIYSLVSFGSADAAEKQPDDKLDTYVSNARGIVEQQVAEEEDPGTVATASPDGRPTVVEMIKTLLRALISSSNDEASEAGRRTQRRRLLEDELLFVDLSSPYRDRVSILQKFCRLKEGTAHDYVRRRLASAFLLLYTRLKTAVPWFSQVGKMEACFVRCLVYSRLVLPWVSILLFHQSHREAYNGIDVKFTYAILCCTAALETYSFYIVWGESLGMDGYGPLYSNTFLEVWPETVAQYSLAGYFVRNKKHNIKMGILSFVGCKNFLDQHWCMEPCSSSPARISSLVLEYLKDGWKQKIRDVATYRSFNDHSSHWGFNMDKPFDECVLLWHLATDFCFFYKKCSQESVYRNAKQCRQMSNYMVYLLFVNPEMLLPGTRRDIFKTAYGELNDTLREWMWNPVCWSRCTPCGVKLIEEEKIVMEKLIRVLQTNRVERASQEESSNEAIARHTSITIAQQNSERTSHRGESFIGQAWAVAKRLMEMDEEDRWKEIQAVWVQMLCFSASRCRGYLHAKALGKGGEFLSYVWLLLFHMGMETFSERLQRELVRSCQGNNDTDFHGAHPGQRRHHCIGFLDLQAQE